MSNFIPLTGGGSIAQQIIDRFQDEPGFDFISYADAQEVTGELFRELIGPDFEPYKDLATYADIQADANAIAFADANANVQKIIDGISESVSGFVLEAPGFELLFGVDIMVFELTPTVSTPETSDVQYRIDGGNWVTIGSSTAINTYSETITGLDPNTTYTIDVRQSLFGTPSIVGTHQVTTESDYSSAASSQSVMEKIANSASLLSATFDSGSIREAFWDSELASNILMDSNNTSRQWMIDNVSHTQSFNQNTSWSQRYSGKAFVLRGKFVGSNANNVQPGHRYVQPGDISRQNHTQAGVDYSDRVYPLQTVSGNTQLTFQNPEIQFVIMDRTDLDGQNL